MIREFFVPRVFIIFIALWAGLATVLMVWSYATKKDQKKFLTLARIPAISGLIALVLTVALMFFVAVFN